MICQVQFICGNWPEALPFSKTLAALARAEKLEEKALFAAYRCTLTKQCSQHPWQDFASHRATDRCAGRKTLSLYNLHTYLLVLGSRY